MRWYISYPILAAGLAFGFDTLFPGQTGFSGPHRISGAPHAQPDSKGAPVVVLASEALDEFGSRVGAFSPGARLVTAEAPESSSSVLDYLAQALTSPAPEPVPPTPQLVTLAEWKSAIVREPHGAAAPNAQPAEPISRDALTRDIQRELQRVGCYLGEIDGVWGGGSRRAVLVFMDRVNALLPSQEPDVFMLSLLKSQPMPVCGASCPRGQSLTSVGRCVPSTLVAQADETGGTTAAREDDAAWSPVVAQAKSRGPMPYGRMSIGGPRPDDVTELSEGWSRVTSTSLPSDPPAARTAALDAATADGLAEPVRRTVPASSFDSDAVADPAVLKRSKSAAAPAKAKPRPSQRTSSYRQVQHLFQHPLGRL